MKIENVLCLYMKNKHILVIFQKHTDSATFEELHCDLLGQDWEVCDWHLGLREEKVQDNYQDATHITKDITLHLLKPQFHPVCTTVFVFYDKEEETILERGSMGWLITWALGSDKLCLKLSFITHYLISFQFSHLSTYRVGASL